ncbi:protein AGENET DOMAIN (AGD)-CONTAINING P1-like [Lycium barbarum]|uniref:protein AGENET DOMAIN (AGD)-CONTAINING P1-like n=1 Tax=Lycium barbarum TaxID=112863 RepID=UPI00293E2373|nr:protein AGENET DOMAIN (AGD)-CONTAINING P1-like [Lycium barbarum]
MAPLVALKKQHSRIAYPKVIKSTTTTFKKQSQNSKDIGFFRKGDHVEVASKEDGFLDSYYEAIVISQPFKKDYIIQYKTLLKDDLSGPLKELVTLSELRPVPPRITANVFSLFDQVDAFDNDGWWVGIITGKIGTKYYVYFDTFGVECEYDESDLRAHQDWVDGQWISSKEQLVYNLEKYFLEKYNNVIV